MQKPVIISLQEIKKFYKMIHPRTHKGIQGHALLIGGSYGKIGAMVLASKATLKSGCGLVTTFTPKCGYIILQTSNPEVMVLTDKNEEHITKIEFQIKPQAIGIGPGMGQCEATQNAFHEFLKTNVIPLVIDADALNILSLNPSWLSLLPTGSILTPHLKELERLVGKWNSEEEKFQKTIDFSMVNNVIMVIKGAPTFIISHKTILENSTGNAALATAGSGDTLTGIITSLLAQGYLPIEAAQLGVYIHGLTADIALPVTGFQSFIASDITNYLGEVFLKIEKGS